MYSMLTLHRFKLLTLLVIANAGALLYLSLGELKPMEIWSWTDIAGEGGSALLVLVWAWLLLKGRPAGRVTNLLFFGLACLFCSLWMDSLDEFIALPETMTLDHWLEVVLGQAEQGGIGAHADWLYPADTGYLSLAF